MNRTLVLTLSAALAAAVGASVAGEMKSPSSVSESAPDKTG